MQATFPSKLQVGEQRIGGRELVLVGPTNKTKKPEWTEKVWTAFETGDSDKLRKMKVSREQFLQLNEHRQETGIKGEEIVLKAERKRLSLAGRADLASKVSRISELWPFEGYDIRSFETNGEKRYIEVKATTGIKKKFPMTENEWGVAKLKRRKYFIYRVIGINATPQTKVFQDPVDLEARDILKRTPLSWFIEYR